MMKGGGGRERGETTIVSSKSKLMRDDERAGARIVSSKSYAR